VLSLGTERATDRCGTGELDGQVWTVSGKSADYVTEEL